MIDRSLRRENRMPSVKLCPKCNQLPKVKFKKKWFKHICVISCANIGCPFFYPIVMTGLNEEKVMKRAVDRWNERVEDFYNENSST